MDGEDAAGVDAFARRHAPAVLDDAPAQAVARGLSLAEDFLTLGEHALPTLSSAFESLRCDRRAGRSGAAVEASAIHVDASWFGVRCCRRRVRRAPHPRGVRELAEHRFVSSSVIAMLEIAVGNLNGALDAFEVAARQRSPWLSYFLCQPRLDVLRGEPRFQSLASWLGFGSAATLNP